MNNPKQFEKVYSCSKCNAIGGGNRMVDHILIDTCDGKLTRKLREAERDGKYIGRETEAILNTRLLIKQESLKQLKVTYREMKWAIKNDIIEMQEISKDFLPEAYEQYFTKVF